MKRMSLVRIRTFLAEARRRKVYTTLVAYIAVCVVMVELGGAILEALLLPDWAPRLLTVLLLLGFPVVLVLAWIFDVGPAGIHRTGPAGPVLSPAGGAGPVRRVAGAPMAALAALRGKSAQARATPTEEESSAAAPDPERLRQAVLAHVRHELRTPINAIIGYSEMLLEDAEEAGDREAAGDLRRIGEAGHTLLETVTALLHPDRVGDRELDSFGAQVRADLRDPTTAIVGYAELLIETSRETGDDRRVPDLERILSASRKLLELSSDIVSVATAGEAAGDGAAPSAAMARDVLSKLRPLKARPEGEDAAGRLLVVDDNAMNRDLLSRQLARRGFTVAVAVDGIDALERLEEQEFDLVLLDLIMPRMDGVETLRRIKRDDRLSRTPVIMISSLDEIDSVVRCLEIGAQDYLTKPFHPTLLEVRIRAALASYAAGEREAFYEAQLELFDTTTRQLMRSLFPDAVAEALRSGAGDGIDVHGEAVVLACHFERHASARGRLDPDRRVTWIRDFIAPLETAAAAHGLELLIRDPHIYMLGASVEAAAAVVHAAFDAIERHGAQAQDEATPLRFGLHIGAAMGARVSGDRVFYHFWGEAVALAVALEAAAAPGTVHLSPAAAAVLRDHFPLVSRGVVEVGASGQMKTYALASRVPVVT
jgi:adenylate cyclase